MEPALSAQLVLALAAQEAAAGAFEEIEPPHIFNAILKFAEMEEPQFEQLLREPSMSKTLIPERGGVRERLEQCGISVPDKSRLVRHQLRGELGKGGHPYDANKVIHRSSVSKEVCREAESIARAGSESKWSAGYLLDALISLSSNKGKELGIERALVGAEQKKETPLLDEHGVDLTALAAAGRLKVSADEMAIKKDAVCKVVMEELLGKDKNVLLIETGKRLAREVVEAVAQLFVGVSPPSGVKGKRIVAIQTSQEIKAPPRAVRVEFEKRISALMGEATQASSVILYMDRFHEFVGENPLTDISGLLKEVLSRGEVQCIATVDADNYARYMKGDGEWQRIFRIISVHDVTVPDQL